MVLKKSLTTPAKDDFPFAHTSKRRSGTALFFIIFLKYEYEILYHSVLLHHHLNNTHTA